MTRSVALLVCLVVWHTGHCDNHALRALSAVPLALSSASLSSEPQAGAYVPTSPLSASGTRAALPRTVTSGVIRPGDILDVTVANEPSLSGQFAVTSNGKVKLPRFLGAINVVGLNTSQLAQLIIARCTKYLVEPSAVVAIVGRPPTMVHVLGEVARQGAYDIDMTPTLLGLLAAAGGVTPSGDPGRIVIVRRGREEAVGITDSAGAEPIPNDVPLEPSDTVVVPRKVVGIVTVTGAVQRPGYFPIDQAGTCTRAFILAGGGTPGATLADAYVLRGAERIRVDLLSILAGNTEQAQDIALQDKDVLIVPMVAGESGIGAPQIVIVTGAVNAPGAVPLLQAGTAGQAAMMAGGLAEGADPRSSYVLRAGERIDVDVRAAMTGSPDRDPVLQANDILVIPSLPRDSIYVVGAVAQPGPQFIRWADSLAKAVTLAGGLTPLAHTDRAYILRDGEPIRADVAGLLSGDTTADQPLQANDLLVIPARTPEEMAAEQLAQSVAIAGAVARPGLLPLSQAGTVARAIIFAGGAAVSADLKNAYVLRNDQRQPVDAQLALSGTGIDPELRTHDMLVIPEFSRVPAVVVGAVNQPGPISLTLAQSVGKLVALAGGLAPQADAKNAYLMRDGSRVSVDVTSILSGGPDTAVKPNDLLVVPTLTAAGKLASSVLVMGAVTAPAVLAAEESMTARTAILQVGGFTSNADSASAYLLRRDQKSKIDLGAIVAGRLEDFALVGGDVLVVPDKLAEVVYVAGAVRQPGPQPRSWSNLLGKALAMAGSLPSADLARVQILRGSEKLTVQADEVLHGTAEDVRLEANDLVIVPPQTPAEQTATLASKSVVIIGAVPQPGMFSPDQCGTVARALAWAGGVAAQADAENSYVLRGSDAITVDAADVIAQPDTSAHNIPLQSGDVLVVPELTPEMAAARQLSRIVMVTGAVRQPGMLSHQQAPTCGSALALAGSGLPDADLEAAYVLRSGRRYDLDLAGIEAGEAEDFDLLPGDVLIVPAKPTEMVFVAGAVASPGALPLDQAGSALTALTMAGGSTAVANTQEAFILRGPDRITVDLGKLMGHEVEDVSLAESDVLVVPIMRPDPIYVVGAVPTPMSLPISQAPMASKALAMAGGASDEMADLKSAYLLRDSERVPVDLDAVINGGIPSADVALQPYDTLIIPRRKQSYVVLGEVQTPGAYTLIQADTIVGALALAGGASPFGDLAAATILREGKSLPVDLEALMLRNDATQNVAMQAGDTLIIPRRKERVFVFGSVSQPGAFPFTQDETHLDIIAKAGGLTPAARVDRIWLVRATQKAQEQSEAAPLTVTAPAPEPVQRSVGSRPKPPGPGINKYFGDRWKTRASRPASAPRSVVKQQPKPISPKERYSITELTKLDPESPEARPRNGDLIYVPGPKTRKSDIWQWLLSFGSGALMRSL